MRRRVHRFAISMPDGISKVGNYIPKVISAIAVWPVVTVVLAAQNKKARPRGRRAQPAVYDLLTVGGSAWESNPPAPLCVTHSSFEDCEAHRDLSTPSRLQYRITKVVPERQPDCRMRLRSNLSSGSPGWSTAWKECVRDDLACLASRGVVVSD